MHYDDVKVPVVVSVSGHTDLSPDEIGRIRDEIRGFLNVLREYCPHSDIILMSAMMKGSDILAASVAMELGLYVAPVLSEEPDVFRRKFADGQDSGLFDSVMGYGRCLDPKIIRLSSDDPGVSIREISAYMISSSHLMIALWDGRSYAGKGVTYSNLKMAYNGCDWVHLDDYRDDIFGHDYADIAGRGLLGTKTLGWTDNCLIYWIQVSRTSDSEYLTENKGCLMPEIENEHHTGYIQPELFRTDVGACAAYRVTDPHYNSGYLDLRVENELPKRYGDMLREIDSMNSELSGTCGREEHRDRLLSADSGSVKDADVAGEIESIKAKGVMGPCAERFAAAEELADGYAKKWIRSSVIILAVALANSIIFSLFVLSNKNVLSGVIFLISTVIMLTINIRIGSKKYRRRFIQYSSLTETMRIVYYRGLMGIRCRPNESCNNMVKADLFWFVNIMKAWQSGFANDYPEWGSFDKKKRVAVAKTCWLQDRLSENVKLEYGDSGHKSVIQRNGNRRMFALLNKILNIMGFAVSLVSIILVVYLIWCYQNDYPIGPLDIFGMQVNFETIMKAVLIAMMAVLTAVTVMSTVIISMRNSRNEAQIRTFGIAKRKLERSYLFDEVTFGRMSKDDVDILVLKELGDLILTELNDWVSDQMRVKVEGKKTFDTNGLV